jgi:hypothetical protein
MKTLLWVLPLLSLLALSSAIASTNPWAKPMNTASDEPSELALSPQRPQDTANNSYQQVIERTVAMVSDARAQELAQQAGLNILDITWEDTGRYNNSSVGPNISDMTIQVQHRDRTDGQYRLSLMPVIRHPNFADETADIPIDQFFLLVGNQRGDDLQRVSLRDFLGNLRRYLSQPDSWSGRETSLLAPRDTHVLVSAQACFLPIAQGETAQFNPVLFNYQSYAGNPAVLTILATREGTSVTIIDNQRDGFEAGPTWGQRLFFNHNGERASLTGERLSDFMTGSDRPSPQSPSATAAREDGLNMVMLIQVPLRQREPMRQPEADMMPAAPVAQGAASRESSNVEAAVIGHGEVEGPFTEIDNLAIERDPRFPIRVTVQFYKATSNGIVSETDMQQIKQQIARVYDDADYVGSLVVDGPSDRPTEYDGSHQQPRGWWENFWRGYEQDTGRSPADVMELLRWLRGERR